MEHSQPYIRNNKQTIHISDVKFYFVLHVYICTNHTIQCYIVNIID